MALTKTEKILIVGDAAFLALAISSYFFPQLADLRKELWGIFIGYNSALMLCLKTDGGSTPPMITNSTLLTPPTAPYTQFFPTVTAAPVPYAPGNQGISFGTTGNISSANTGIATGPAQPAV